MVQVTDPRAVEAERVGIGRTAEILPWEEGWVLKLYFDWVPRTLIEREERATRGAQEAGLPAPATKGVVEVGARAGLLLERIDGRPLIDSILAHPWTLPSGFRLLADLHAAVHSRPAPDGLPAQRDLLDYVIRNASALPDSMRAPVLTQLHRLPVGSSLCHGDLHPGNVLLSPRGPVIIDWMTASAGDPLGDVARTLLLFRLGADPSKGRLANAAIGLSRRAAGWIYLRRYLSRHPASRREIDAWEVPIAAARLREEIPGEARDLRAMLSRQLSRPPS